MTVALVRDELAGGILIVERARRHVTLMVVPLAVLAFGLVASILVPYGYPMKWMVVTLPLEDLSPFDVIYVGAGILAVSIALASRRGAPPGVIATVTALLAILGASIMTGIAVKVFSDDGYWTHVLVFVAPIAVSLVVTFQALGMRGWDRMLWLLGAFAIAALPYSCPLIPGMFNLFSGGIVYVMADLTLLALFIRGLR
jgi:hypothetical protein